MSTVSGEALMSHSGRILLARQEIVTEAGDVHATLAVMIVRAAQPPDEIL